MRFFCLFFLTERMMLVSVVHNRPDRTTCVCISKPLCTATSSLWPSSKTHFSPTEEKKKKRLTAELFFSLYSLWHCVLPNVQYFYCILLITWHQRDSRSIVDRMVFVERLAIFYTLFFIRRGKKKKRKWGNFLKESGLKESFGPL